MSDTDCKHDTYRIALTHPPCVRTMTQRRMEWCDACGKLLDEREWRIPSISDDPPPPPLQPTPEDYEALRAAQIEYSEAIRRVSRECEELRRDRDAWVKLHADLQHERDELHARCCSLVYHIPADTIAGDVQKWRDEYVGLRIQRDNLIADRDAWAKLHADLLAELAQAKELPQ